MAKVAVPLAAGFEETEAVVIIDLLRRGGVEVAVAGLEAEDVAGAHGIVFKSDCLLAHLDAESLDGIVLPGGMPGTKNLQKSARLRDLIVRLHGKAKLVAAVCAAPVVLAAAGVLKGKKAACYPGFESDLKDATVVNEPVVVDGNIITSRGIGTAVAFALALVACLKGPEVSEKVRKAILA
jgi:4-methyl-5(b-hydroxyethyl)-thiazole monophosphate biosynthesis